MTDEKCAYYHKGFCLKGMIGTICELDGCVAHILDKKVNNELTDRKEITI